MPDEARVDEFLRLHTRHEPRLHAFVLSLLPNWSDAEDVLQETAPGGTVKVGDVCHWLRQCRAEVAWPISSAVSRS